MPCPQTRSNTLESSVRKYSITNVRPSLCIYAISELSRAKKRGQLVAAHGVGTDTK